MDIGAIVLLGFFAWLGWKMLKGFDKGRNKTMHCTLCGHEGPTKMQTRGSLAVEILLWICFLIPGLIYTAWRHASRGQACELCGSNALVPLNAPVAQAARKRMPS